MSKTFICKGCKEKYDINMQSSNTGYCYICNEFYMKQQLANSEAQNKRVLEKLELLVRSNQELELALEIAVNIANLKSVYSWTIEELKDKAKEKLKKYE